jgi:hypothetical protein
MIITPLEAVLETDLIGRGIDAEEHVQGTGFGFETTPDGVVTAICRRNRDRLLAGIEGDSR